MTLYIQQKHQQGKEVVLDCRWEDEIGGPIAAVIGLMKWCGGARSVSRVRWQIPNSIATVAADFEGVRISAAPVPVGNQLRFGDLFGGCRNVNVQRHFGLLQLKCDGAD